MRAVAQERQEVWSVKLSVEADLPPVVLLAFVVISFEQFMEILKEGKNDLFFFSPKSKLHLLSSSTKLYQSTHHMQQLRSVSEFLDHSVDLGVPGRKKMGNQESLN